MEHRRPFLALLHGLDGSPSEPKAAVALCQATLASALDEPTSAEARANLAYCQLLGRGTPCDYAAAVTSLRAAGNAGSARAWCLLAYCFKFSFGMRKNSNEERRLFRLAANGGDPLAQACCYVAGNGCERNNFKVARLAKAALDEWPCCAFAQAFLGFCHNFGHGAPQSRKKSVEWYTLAAEQGLAFSQCQLGCFFSFGKGVRQDDKKAVRWYTLAAEQGYPQAQFILGNCFDHGKGVPHDWEEAVRWFTLAGEQGHVDAQRKLAKSFHRGEGVPQDFEEAARWYILLAEQGDYGAFSVVIKFIKNEESVPLSPTALQLFLFRGMKSGHEGSMAMLNELMRGTFWHWSGPLRTVYSHSFYSRVHCALWCAQQLVDNFTVPYLPVEMWGIIFGFLRFEPYCRHDFNFAIKDLDSDSDQDHGGDSYTLDDGEDGYYYYYN